MLFYPVLQPHLSPPLLAATPRRYCRSKGAPLPPPRTRPHAFARMASACSARLADARVRRRSFSLSLSSSLSLFYLFLFFSISPSARFASSNPAARTVRFQVLVRLLLKPCEAQRAASQPLQVEIVSNKLGKRPRGPGQGRICETT